MALTGAQKGIEEPGTQSSMHSGGCDPGECSSENPRMQCSQEVRRVFRSRRQRPAIKCAWPAPQAARCRGTQAPRLCRFGKFDSPERVMRLDFVSFGGFITASTTHPCYGIRAFYGIRGLVLIFCNDPFLIRIDQPVPELRVGQYQSAICPVGLH